MNKKLRFAIVVLTMLVGSSGSIVLGWPFGMPVSVTQRVCEETEGTRSRLTEDESRITALEKALGFPAAGSQIPGPPEPLILKESNDVTP